MRSSSHRPPPPSTLLPKLVIGASRDPLEREADRAADAAMAAVGSPRGVSGGPTAPGRMGASSAGEARVGGGPLQAKPSAGVQAGALAPASVHSVLGQPGRAIEPASRAFLESSFGHSLADVRIHDGGDASASAADVGAKAYTVGRNIVFGAGAYRPATPEGRWLLAHEVTHVFQQGAAGVRLQRYLSGEHAQMGDTTGALKRVIEESFKTYKVAVEDYLDTIADSQGTTAGDLKDANPEKLKTITVVRHPATDKGAYMVVPAETSKDDPKGKRVWLTNRTKVEVQSKGKEWADIKVLSGKHAGTEGKIMIKYLTEEAGFEIGAEIRIPTFATADVKDAYHGKAPKIKPHGVELDYGTGVAMGGDLYGTPEAMDAAPEKELHDLDNLIKVDQTAPKERDKEWDTATGGRYLELAKGNEGHFAPPNAAAAPESAAGATSPNHKTEWEKYHRLALDTSKAGDLDKALTVNAFGDHFLTDAFAAGHLFNKRDAMELFKSQLKLKANGKDFTEDSAKFFDGIAQEAFTGDVAKEFSKYKFVETYLGIHWDVNSADRFSKLLQGIYKKQPDLVAAVVSKVPHDALNTNPGGVEVINSKSGPWGLSGDTTLNDSTKRMGQRAVAQSQMNVLSVHGITTPIDYTAMFKAVWDYVPKPTAKGLKTVTDAVKSGTDITSTDVRKALVALIKEHYLELIKKLLAETPPALEKA